MSFFLYFFCYIIFPIIVLTFKVYFFTNYIYYLLFAVKEFYINIYWIFLENTSIFYYITTKYSVGCFIALKLILIMANFAVVRASYPRFRYDQSISLVWLYLLPISLMQLLFNAGFAVLYSINNVIIFFTKKKINDIDK